jgi:hypothetical protein
MARAQKRGRDSDDSEDEEEEEDGGGGGGACSSAGVDVCIAASARRLRFDLQALAPQGRAPRVTRVPVHQWTEPTAMRVWQAPDVLPIEIIGTTVVGKRLGAGTYSRVFEDRTEARRPAAFKVVSTGGGSVARLKAVLGEILAAHVDDFTRFAAVDTAGTLYLFQPRALRDLAACIHSNRKWPGCGSTKHFGAGMGAMFTQMVFNQQRGVTNLDVKPENLLVFPDPRHGAAWLPYVGDPGSMHTTADFATLEYVIVTAVFRTPALNPRWTEAVVVDGHPTLPVEAIDTFGACVVALSVMGGNRGAECGQGWMHSPFAMNGKSAAQPYQAFLASKPMLEQRLTTDERRKLALDHTWAAAVVNESMLSCFANPESPDAVTDATGAWPLDGACGRRMALAYAPVAFANGGLFGAAEAFGDGLGAGFAPGLEGHTVEDVARALVCLPPDLIAMGVDLDVGV